MAVYDPNDIVKNPQGTYPQNAIAGQEWARCEPMLTAELLQRRFLFGIPLVSQVVNPLTKKPDVLTPDVLTDHIFRAIATLEAELQIAIFPIQVEEQMPWDRVFLEQFTYVRVKNKPILSVDHLVIRPQNNTRAQDIYRIPPEWISITNGAKGQVNVIPLVTADSETFPQAVTGNGALFLLSMVSKLPWTPSYWQIRYTAGFPENQVPRVITELIGIQATLEILSLVAATFRISGYSLGLDGLSQSQTLPGPQLYKLRTEELMAKKKILLQRVKKIYATSLAMGTI